MYSFTTFPPILCSINNSSNIFVAALYFNYPVQLELQIASASIIPLTLEIKTIKHLPSVIKLIYCYSFCLLIFSSLDKNKAYCLVNKVYLRFKILKKRGIKKFTFRISNPLILKIFKNISSN